MLLLLLILWSGMGLRDLMEVPVFRGMTEGSKGIRFLSGDTLYNPKWNLESRDPVLDTVVYRYSLCMPPSREL